jgi:hypothetical protein
MIEIFFEEFPRFENDWNVCLGINDPEAGNFGSFLHNIWTILESRLRTYNFSSTCNLDADDFESLNSISAYPDLVSKTLNFDNFNQIELDQTKVYNMEGRLVKSFLDIKENIDLEDSCQIIIIMPYE